ncbi:MAG: hypothetical protein U0836_09020 [Pirellulales bacterium]
MSIPLHLAVYGGLIPAAVAALVFYLGALATRRVAWSGAPWAGVAIAVGFVAASRLLGEAAPPWIPRTSRDWLPALVAAGALVGVLLARFDRVWLAWLSLAGVAALAGWTLVPSYAAIAPRQTAWRVGLAIAVFTLCVLCRRAARAAAWSQALVLALSFVAGALLIERSGGLSLAQLAGAGCATTAAVAVCGGLLGVGVLPPAAAPVSALLLVGLCAQGYFEGFGVGIVSFALVAAAPAAHAAVGAWHAKLTPRSLFALRLGAAILLLAAGVLSAYLPQQRPNRRQAAAGSAEVLPAASGAKTPRRTATNLGAEEGLRQFS